jgi:hypothetical protein
VNVWGRVEDRGWRKALCIYVCVYECFCKKEAIFGGGVAGGKGARYKEEVGS